MNDKLLQGNRPIGQDFFRNVRNVVGYGVTHDVTGDWTRGLDNDFAAEKVAADSGLSRSLLAVPFNADARTTFLLNMNRGQLMDDQDRMVSASKNKQYLSEVDQMYKSLIDEGVDVEQAKEAVKKSDSYIKLVENGVFDDDFDTNVSSIEDLFKKNEDDYNSAFEDFQTDLADIERHKKDHSISAYYTRQANKPNQDNWFYSQPTTAGLSSSSWKEQAASFTAGLGVSIGTHAIAGAMIGGTSGTAVAPGVGTAAGGAAGGIAGAGYGLLKGLAVGLGKFLFKDAVAGVTGATAAQLAGGMQAREQESHIEAFDAYSSKLNESLAEYGIDQKAVADNLRKQAKELQYSDVDEIADNDLIAMAAADNRFKFDFEGGRQVVQAMDDAFRGTRRVYEQNNALGAAEFATDMLIYTPLNPEGLLGKTLGFGRKIPGVNKLYTPFDYLQNTVMKTGIDMSKFAAKTRNMARWHYGSDMLQRIGLNYIQESTEEGAQNLIQKKYKQGDYKDEIANNSLLDAITDGNLFMDMGENLLFRTETGLAFLGMNSEYKNDAQLHEEMMSGGLLSLLSGQSMVMNTVNAVKAYQQSEKAYGLGKYIEEALKKDAETNAYETFYRNMRKYDFKNIADYEVLLDGIRRELKSAKTNKDGTTTRKWNINTDALYKIIGPVNENLTDEDGNPVQPTSGKITDEDIDKFIDIQNNMANNMFAIKKKYLDPLWKKFKNKYKDALDTDQDAYYSAATMAYAEYLNAIENADKSEQSFSNLTSQLQNKSKDQLAFTTAWYNDFLIELKKQRALQENNFLTAQTEALNGNSPMSLTEQLRNFLQPIDDMIGEYEAEFVNFLHENDLERNQLGLEDIDYISQSGYDDIQNAGLSNVFNNGEYTADDILNHHMQKMLYIGSIINKKAFSDRWQDITHESADKMKQRLDAYKKAKNDKFKQAQTDGKSQAEQTAVA